MRQFELDLSRFANKLSKAGDIIGKGVKIGMYDVLDDWKREATDLAPLDKGTLRRSITTELAIGGKTFEGTIAANATERSGSYGRFNYAYYIHEVGGEIKNPTTPGTIDKFIDKPADENKDRWLKLVEQEIEKQLRRDGW